MSNAQREERSPRKTDAHTKGGGARGGTLVPQRARWVCSKHPKGRSEPLSTLDQARRVAALAQEKLARDVVILDMRPVCSYTDFFVLCTGQNPRQTKAIYDEVRERLKQDERLIPRSVEGEREATWIVADYLDLVLHVFTPDARAFYRLEELWGDVPAIELEAAAS